jgi:hypothetical protein
MPIGSGGVMIDGEYTVEAALRLISGNQASGSSPGSTIQEFSSRRARQAKLETPPPATLKKSGAVIGIYDPQLSALLAGET